MRWFAEEEAPTRPVTFLDKACPAQVNVRAELTCFVKFYAGRDGEEVLTAQ